MNNKISFDENGKIIYPFDEIYMILLIESETRKKNVNDFLYKFNSSNDVKIIETVKKPWMNFLIDDNINYCNYKKGYETISAFDCAINHYNIIKSSYEKGLNRIMIIEDDANFICNIDEYIKIINDIPNDADILHFIPNEIVINNFHKDSSWLYYKIYDNKLRIRNKNGRWSTIMYILNRNGMKYFIDYYDNNLTIADKPLFDFKSDLNYYVCNKPVINNLYKSNIKENS